MKLKEIIALMVHKENISLYTDGEVYIGFVTAEGEAFNSNPSYSNIKNLEDLIVDRIDAVPDMHKIMGEWVDIGVINVYLKTS